MTRPSTHRHAAWAILALALGRPAPAQNPDGALQPPPQPNAEMLKWLDTVEAQWQPAFARDVTAPFDAEKAKLAQQYTASLEANLAKASGAGNLDAAVVWRNERDRFAAERGVPADDEANTPTEMKQLRAAWRTQAAKAETDRATRAKAMHARYDQVLAQAQTQLTQKQRIEDAVMVKNRRDEIAAAWLPPQVEASANAAISTKTESPIDPLARTAMPSTTPTPKPPLGTATVPMSSTSARADVEAQDVVISKLEEGGKAFNDRDYRLTSVPSWLRGYKFTRSNAHSRFLRFKVLTNGTVFMGCTARWGNIVPPAEQGELTTEAALLQQGWVRVNRGSIDTGDNNVSWLIFSRPCKAGEQFTYRTEKNTPPILLLK